MHIVEEYARKVVYNEEYKKMCGKYEILACERHLKDLERAGTEDFPFVFDPTRADRIYKHFEIIPRIDIAGEMIRLEDWQKFDLGCMMGWVHQTTGKRRFKISYNRIARGHAKTTCSAAVGTFFLCGDAIYPPGHPEQARFELQPSVNIVAVDKNQGKRNRDDIATMAETVPEFSKRIEVKKTYIRNRKRGGEVVVFSKDKNNKDGGRPSLIITEEWHAHLTSDVHDVAVSSKGKKLQCLEYIITTAGTDAENKPCYRDDLQYKQVLEGTIQQEDVFVMIREIDDDDSPHDEFCWKKANPFFRSDTEYSRNLLEEVQSAHQDAYNNNNPDKIREFLIKRMNRWQTDSEHKYFSGCMEKFKKLLVSREEFLELTKGTPGHYGFDLGKTMDLSGTAYVTQLPDMRVAVSVHGFLPQNRATEHEHSDRVPYKAWAKDGWVTLTPGDVTDNRYVERWILEREEKNGWTVREIDYDGHNATDMAIRLAEKYGEEKVVEIPQTCAGLNQATKRFRELVLSGQVVAEESPLLLWCLDNAIEVTNNYGDIKLSKKHKSDTQRIDPVAAMMNALARLIVAIDNNININQAIEKRGFAIS